MGAVLEQTTRGMGGISKGSRRTVEKQTRNERLIRLAFSKPTSQESPARCDPPTLRTKELNPSSSPHTASNWRQLRPSSRSCQLGSRNCAAFFPQNKIPRISSRHLALRAATPSKSAPLHRSNECIR